ncbi:MAG: glycosyl transferase [Oscillospiraceae bacterium]|nr:glycosyl transferase [Oscillospiraceae bacterium]
MIPRIIHYCWFGRNPKPKLAEKCFNSWERFCPDYCIREWNEDNFDISSAPLYVQQAYAAQKWAFVADYVRLKVVYDHGGIYLDTDVELVKSFDSLLSYSAFFGFEGINYINTGLGFGAVRHSPIVQELISDYAEIPFVMHDGSYDLTPCPTRNTPVFVRNGLLCDGTQQLLNGEILILPAEYLCPIDNATRILRKTQNTISIHHFDASWQSPAERRSHDDLARKRRHQLQKESIFYFPKKAMRTILGDHLYESIKRYLGRGVHFE